MKKTIIAGAMLAASQAYAVDFSSMSCGDLKGVYLGTLNDQRAITADTMQKLRSDSLTNDEKASLSQTALEKTTLLLYTAHLAAQAGYYKQCNFAADLSIQEIETNISVLRAKLQSFAK